MKFIPVAFTPLFLWVIKLQPYLLRFSEESIKTGFMSRTNVFLFMPLIQYLRVLGTIINLEMINIKSMVDLLRFCD